MPHPPSKKGYKFRRLSYDTLGACIDVQRQLGLHCTEIDYQRALALALPKRSLHYQREVEIPIAYEGVVVTKRRVDFVVWNDTGELLPETKARSQILPEDIEQCLLYLHQGRYQLCLLEEGGHHAFLFFEPHTAATYPKSSRFSQKISQRYPIDNDTLL